MMKRFIFSLTCLAVSFCFGVSSFGADEASDKDFMTPKKVKKGNYILKSLDFLTRF
ncbi:MAG: hypothetical protein KBC90_08905 [Spirochaetes bacterium]|nr:hypothetical protein [Spirochaetota bacterium]